MASLSYMQPEFLVDMLRDPERCKRVVVLDVRDEDFAGGHVRGCVNIPCIDFRGDTLDEFIHKHLHDGVEMCVVHCFLSQQRGPTCAQRLAQRLLQLERGGKPQVRILAQGWRKFNRLYRQDSDVCCWDD